MKRVVLLNNCVVSGLKDRIQRDWRVLHVGMASIAGYLRAQGCEILVLNPRFDRLSCHDVAKRIVDYEPQFVGYTGTTEEICDAAAIAANVKQAWPDAVNVVGGCHASALPAETLAEFSGFDIAVRGEGELPFGDLVRGVSPGEIQEIAYRDADGTPVFTGGQRALAKLDDLPLPAWNLFDVRRYRPPMLFEFIRGCPYRCTFCFHTVGHRVRYKSPERCVEEVAHCYEKYGVRNMYFGTNGTWPLTKPHAVSICEKILRRGLKLRWRTSTRVDLLDDELIALMRRAGCVSLDLGLESGSEAVLEHCLKQATVAEAIPTVEACHRHGIEVEINFLLGLPYEDEQSLKETLALVKRLRRHSTIANFALLMPFPGTTIYEMARRNEAGMRITTSDWRLYTKQAGGVLDYNSMSQEELYRWQARLYRDYYFSPRKILNLLKAPEARRLITPSRAMFMLKTLFS